MRPANRPQLRLLVVEDSEDDALLMVDALRTGGYDPEAKRVTTGGGMRDALAAAHWNLILSDYRLPEFNALEAFAVYREFGLDVPFLIVSGAIGEETAAAAMRAGVHDYVSKGNLALLAPAVNRELREAETRREHARAEAALRSAHAETAAIQANVPALLLIADEDLNIRAANNPQPSDTLLGCMACLADTQDCAFGIRPLVADTLANGTRHQNIETWIPVFVQGVQEEHCFMITTALLHSDAPRKALIFAHDVTDLKLAQKRLQALNRDLDMKVEELQKALAEKNILLQEVQHRVKNNLNVISSLLSLQSEQPGSAPARIALAESRDRVRSMALIHEQLCWSEHVAEIELGPYIDRLTRSLLDGYIGDSERIQVITNVDVTLTLDQAVPCGLIIQELFSNSLKHAFPTEPGGEVHIEFHRVGNEYQLSYRDTGPGLPPALNVNATQTLGMQVISDLTAQLHGTIRYFHSGGARFLIAFPAGSR